MDDLVWKTTGKDGSTHCTKEDDDFIACPDDGHILRVEQMDRGTWWWQVYTPKGTALNDGHCATSRADAFALAEMVYKTNLRQKP